MSKYGAFFVVSCSYDVRKLHYSLHVLLCFSKSNDKNIAMYVGFEADGMLAGKSSLLQNIMTLFALLLRCLTQMLNVMT